MPSTDIDIIVNGTARTVPPGLTVESLLRQLDRDPSVPGIAVAVADRVVRRADWPETPIAEGDRVEIITAAQGG
ncbi:MAG: sulfur carrier protein ThiS [Rubricoccaceae bacterium]